MLNKYSYTRSSKVFLNIDLDLFVYTVDWWFILCAQASWKGYKQRKAYKDRLQTLQSNVQTVVKVNNLYHY